MPDSCDYRLAANISAACAEKSVKGLESNAWVINRDDIDFDECTRDAQNPNIITSLVLKTGKRAYTAFNPGKSPFTGTTTSLAEGTYTNKFTKTAAIVILDSGPDVAFKIIDPLANGSFVVIFENKFKGTDKKNTFEIYGFEQGLSANAIDKDMYSEDTDGGWAVTLQEVGAPTSAIYFFADTITATRAALASLVAGSNGQ